MRQRDEAVSRRRSPLLPVVLAVAAAAVGGWLVSGDYGSGDFTTDPGEDEVGTEEDAATTDEVSDDEEVGPWRRLPHSPLVRRGGHSVTWSGEEVIMWGGSRPEPSLHPTRRSHLGSGAAYDPATDRWRRIAPAPIPPRDEHVAAWTGEELVVWGGRAGTVSAAASLPAGAHGRAGAAYDPGGAGWRLLPQGPLDHLGSRAGGAWTGSDLLVWAVDGEHLEVAMYDPADDAWRAGESLRIGSGATVEAVWARERLAVLVIAPGGSGTLYRYAPADATWEHVQGRVFPQPEGFAAVEETLVLWGYTSGEQFGQPWAVALDATTGEMRRLPAPSVRLAREHIAEHAGARLLLWDGRRGAVLDLDQDRWTTLPDAPLSPRVRPSGAWTGRELVVWGGGGGRYHADGARLRPPAPPGRAGGHVSE